MVYLINGDFDWVSTSKMSNSQAYAYISIAKIEMKPERLCSGESQKLLPFVQEVFDYSFAEIPDYEKLKFSLCKFLM